MRYLVGALFLASCTMLVPSPTEDGPTDQPASVMDSEPPESGGEPPESGGETPKLKPKPLPAPTTRISSCADLDAGNLKETIKAKLDCIEENAK